MKMIRFLDEKGDLCRGVYNSDDPEKALLIYGDWWGDWHVADEKRVVSRLLPPVLPPNIFALGLNYRKHADETGMSYPDCPVMFIKATTSVIGHRDPIVLPNKAPNQVDYEAELAVVIGRPAKNLLPKDATGYILGYTCANDVSARDWQFEKQAGQWARGKSFDTFCPIGPWIVSPDEIPDPQSLRIRTTLNGVPVQDSNTSDMIFDIPTIISDLSHTMTLLPGTVILSGTPEGVGFTRRPPMFLGNGDCITISIEGIGELTNSVEREV